MYFKAEAIPKFYKKLIKDLAYKDNLKEKGLLVTVKDDYDHVKGYAVRLTQKGGKFYAKSTIATRYTQDVADEIDKILNTPGRLSDGDAITGQYYPKVTQTEPIDNEPSTRQTQEQQLYPETQKFVDDLLKVKNPITRLEDATEEELKGLGFHESALREWRGMRTASLDLAEARQVRDMKIQELEKENTELRKKVNDLVTQYINSTAMEVADKNDLEKEIDNLKKEKAESDKKLKEEMQKSFELKAEQESQTTRIRRLFVEMIKNSNLPLKDKLQIIFKLEGVTIGSIITAVVMTITSIALAISLSLKSIITPKPDPKPKPKPDPQPGPGPQPDPKPDIPNKVKEGLKKFAEWLKELAKKSFAALPAIIGSIVSFILKSAAAAVGFLAEHMIILVIIIVSSIVYGLVEGVRYIKKSGK